jgi:hypothetical protein
MSRLLFSLLVWNVANTGSNNFLEIRYREIYGIIGKHLESLENIWKKDIKH